MRRFILLSFLAITAITTSCQKEEFALNNYRTTNTVLYSSSEFCSDITSSDLIAGKNTTAGLVEVANDEDSLYVTFETSSGWTLNDIKLFVGDHDDLPLNKAGNAKLGQFPYKESLTGSPSSYTISISLDDISDSVTIAAKVEVQSGNKTEGAWADGTSTGGKSGVKYFTFTTEECEEEECNPVDTAWANGAASVISSGSPTYNIVTDSGDVAGTVTLSGPSSGSYSFTISLNSGWSLQSIDDPIMVRGFGTAQSSFPDPGTFSGFGTYVGSSLSFSVFVANHYSIAVAVESDELCD